MPTQKRKQPTRKAPERAQLPALAPASSKKPTPNELLNFTINSVALCSGYSASAITKDWLLGDPRTDANGDRHPGAGLAQGGIDRCLNPKLNQLITHFGSSNTVSSGTYSPATSVEEVQKDLGQRI